jgi:hypothetical protein
MHNAKGSSSSNAAMRQIRGICQLSAFRLMAGPMTYRDKVHTGYTSRDEEQGDLTVGVLWTAKRGRSTKIRNRRVEKSRSYHTRQ